VNFLERFSTSPQISFCPQPTHFYNHKPVWMRISRTIFVLKKNRSNTTDFSRFFFTCADSILRLRWTVAFWTKTPLSVESWFRNRCDSR